MPSIRIFSCVNARAESFPEAIELTCHVADPETKVASKEIFTLKVQNWETILSSNPLLLDHRSELEDMLRRGQIIPIGLTHVNIDLTNEEYRNIEARALRYPNPTL